MKKSLIKKSVYVIVLLAMIAASIYCFIGAIKIYNNYVSQYITAEKYYADSYVILYNNLKNYSLVIMLFIIAVDILSIFMIVKIILGAKNEILYAKYSIEDFKAEREQEIKTKEQERKNKQLKTLEDQKKLIEEKLDRMKK